MRAVRLFELGGVVMAFVGLSISCDDGPHCSSDLDCRPGNVCEPNDRVCVVPECTSDKDCGQAKVCNVSFKCVAGCRRDDDCPTGSICVDDGTDSGILNCMPGCRADFECELGSVCAFLKCNQGCHSNADCEQGTFCSATPGSEFIFGRPPSRCKPGCHDDGECAPAELCSEGVCHFSCLETSDCGAEGYCASLHALGSVRMDAGLPVECGMGERCACISAPNADSGRASP